MRPNHIFFGLLAFVSFWAGFFHSHPQTPVREPSSMDRSTLNDYENLTCPSDVEIQNLAQKSHLNVGDHKMSCDDPEIGKLLKLFKLANSIKINLPEKWGGTHRETLLAPFEFMAKVPQGYEVNMNLEDVLARNELHDKIVIGSMFFALPPLEALQILIHEARHSSASDPGHVDCRGGDIPKTSGGCDEEFSLAKTAGAYSYGYFFNLGWSLYGQNLSINDREFLLNYALAGIASRFNKVPETLAVPLDLLFVLLEDAKVYQVHPFTYELIPIDLARALGGQTPVRIQYNPVGHGALVFTDQGKVISIDKDRKIVGYYSDILPHGLFLVDSTKLLDPSKGYAYTYFLSKEGDIFYRDVTVQGGKSILSKMVKRPTFGVQKMFMANKAQSYLLSNQGRIYAIAHPGRGHVVDFFPEVKDFVISGQEWVDVSGGATYDSLYGVSSDGHIYSAVTLENNVDVKPEKMDFFAKDPFTKFQEGMNINVGLTSTGELLIRDYARTYNAPWAIPVKGVKDFAVGRSYSPTEFIRSYKLSKTPWSETCGVAEPYLDPWTHQVFGLNERGYLVFQSLKENPCREYISLSAVQSTSIKFVGSELFDGFNNFSQTYIELLKNDQEALKIRPYRRLNQSP